MLTAEWRSVSGFPGGVARRSWERVGFSMFLGSILEVKLGKARPLFHFRIKKFLIYFRIAHIFFLFRMNMRVLYIKEEDIISATYPIEMPSSQKVASETCLMFLSKQMKFRSSNDTGYTLVRESDRTATRDGIVVIHRAFVSFPCQEISCARSRPIRRNWLFQNRAFFFFGFFF